MKKILICILIFISAANAFAQKILVDRVDDLLGFREVICTAKSETLDGWKYEFGLSAWDNPNSGSNDLYYTIIVVSNYPIPNEGILLFKLDNDDIISPKFLSTTDNTTSTGILTRTVFTIDKTDLNKLATHGIVKMRISNRTSYYEKNWKKDKLGKWLYNSYLLIQNKFNISRESEILQDF